jgi:hypothetical protein
VTLPWRCGAAAAIDLLIQLYLFHSTFTAAIIQSRWRRRALRPSRAPEMLRNDRMSPRGCGCRAAALAAPAGHSEKREFLIAPKQSANVRERVNVAWGRSRFEVSRAFDFDARDDDRSALCVCVCLRNGVTLPNFWQLPVLRTLAYTLFGRFQNKSRTCSKSQAARVVYNDVQKSGIIGQHRRRSKRAAWKCPHRRIPIAANLSNMSAHFDENLTSEL